MLIGFCIRRAAALYEKCSVFSRQILLEKRHNDKMSGHFADKMLGFVWKEKKIYLGKNAATGNGTRDPYLCVTTHIF